ncbi:MULTISPECIES: hypothetical protein [unclassified Nocardia]|uniref:hypothetical protein n=1 Tax=unclassified Nocardia TaxID=2637762 RepID=UPI00278BC60F|nr:MULTISPECIES: hypothetical protein [unclassified Nocardia]
MDQSSQPGPEDPDDPTAGKPWWPIIVRTAKVGAVVLEVLVVAQDAAGYDTASSAMVVTKLAVAALRAVTELGP